MEHKISSLLIITLIFCVLPKDEDKQVKVNTEPEDNNSLWPEEIFRDEEYEEMLESFPRT